MIAFRVVILQFGEQNRKNHAVDIDSCGKGITCQKAVLAVTIFKGILQFGLDGEVLDCGFRDAAVFAGFTDAVALVAFLIRDVAGIVPLVCDADGGDEAFLITLLFRGHIDPLTKGTVIDLGVGLIFIGYHIFGSFQIRENPQKPFHP